MFICANSPTPFHIYDSANSRIRLNNTSINFEKGQGVVSSAIAFYGEYDGIFMKICDLMPRHLYHFSTGCSIDTLKALSFTVF